MNPADLIKEILYSALSVVKGMIMTMKNLLGLPVRSYYSMLGKDEPENLKGKRIRRVTQHYPEEQWALAPRFRGMPTPTVVPETGEMYCIACLACVRICPTQIIDIQWHKPGAEEEIPPDPITGKPKVKLIDRFEIDMGRCLFCALCVEACPTNPKSIVMSREFELGGASRIGMVFEDRRLPGTKVLPMAPVSDSDDQPATAYVNAAIAMAKKKGE
ncbi:MAG TPA: 4Fe-4S dicluster domain-containing protein [Armatimonadota bacterium]|nr:4Fe-4S dicluster domain-containing protein [Armatimonadota bacterium]